MTPGTTSIGPSGLVPSLARVGVRAVGLADLPQAVRGQRLGTLLDQQRLIERVGRRAAPRGHGVLVGDRGGDDGAERHQQDRHQQRDAALVARHGARALAPGARGPVSDFMRRSR